MKLKAPNLDAPLFGRIVAHCSAELPNEACGLLAFKAGNLIEVYPSRNLADSPHRFVIDPDDHAAAWFHAESQGWELAGVYHSHPNGSSRLSDEDLEALGDGTHLVIALGKRTRARWWRVLNGKAKSLGRVG